MDTIRYWLRDAFYYLGRGLSPFLSFIRWIALRAIPLAFVIGLATLLYQVAATEMQAEALSWDALTTQSAAGDLGKVAALEHLNKDSTIRIPFMGGWLGFSASERDWYGFKVDKNLALVVPVPPHFRGRTNLKGLDLGIGTDSGACPEKSMVLQGLKLQGALLGHADFNCINFEGEVFSGLDYAMPGGLGVSADFSFAQLPAANFSKSKLSFANFSNAVLLDAKFNNATLFQAQFEGADGDYAKFNDIDLKSDTGQRKRNSLGGGQNLSATKCSGSALCLAASCFDHSVFSFERSQSAISLDFRGASLRDTKISGEIITANFGPIEIIGTEPRNADTCRRPTQDYVKPDKKIAKRIPVDLSEADLRFVVWRGTNFQNANLFLTRFSNADLSHALNLEANQIREACFDDTTVLPKRLRELSVHPNELCKKAGVENPLDQALRSSSNDQECNADSNIVGSEFRGTVSFLDGGTICITMDNDVSIKFVDSSVEQAINAVGKVGSPLRVKIDAGLAKWATSSNIVVVCVQNPNFDQDVISFSMSRKPGSEVAKPAPDERNVTTWIGWCRVPAKDSIGSPKSLAEVVSEQILSIQKAERH